MSVDLILFSFFRHYRPQRSRGQGNVFTTVCHSFCSQGGGGLPQYMLGYQPPQSRHPPPRSRHPRPPPPPRPDTPGPPTPRPDTPGSRPPRADPPQSRHQAPQPPLTRHPQSRPPRPDTPLPPGKQTPAYGQRAAGTHPTGMQYCSIYFTLNYEMSDWNIMLS